MDKTVMKMKVVNVLFTSCFDASLTESFRNAQRNLV